MQVEDLMTARLIGGPGDGREMMTPDTNTAIHISLETDDAYEIHRYEVVEGDTSFEWVGKVR